MFGGARVSRPDISRATRRGENGVVTSAGTVGSVGLGVDAGLSPSVARELAVRCAALGYGSLWCNDEPEASGLETLAHFTAGAPQLDLGVGVLPIDQHPPSQIASEVDRLELDPGKLWIGIGAGRLKPQLAPMRDAVAELRDLLPAARIMIGAMRPHLARLGGQLADGVLLNWMMPAHAAEARGWVHEGAVEAGRAAPITALYIRVAVGAGASQRLTDEESRYRRLAVAHFAAIDVPLGAVGVSGSARTDVVEALAPYRSVLELPIVRVLAGDDLPALVAVAEAAAP
jgi:alkanesulfonate monooxygenase SsuD/methylene tetrahydromethanopterin reductase-like flavin-dependent oxidoreductase (luciferase family)